MIMFTIVQVVCFIILIKIKPFDSKVDNFLEIMNDVFYIFFIIFLWTHKLEDSWDGPIVDTFFWVLLSNNLIIMLIMNSKHSQ